MVRAFTLAEVLITLGIIGVVAAMTMPALIAEHREKQYIVSLKKSYSLFSQLYIQALSEYGPPEDWMLYGPNNYIGSKNWFNKMFDKKIKIAALCDGISGCFPNKPYQSLRGGNNISPYEDRNMIKFVLVDGTFVGIKSYSINCTAQKNGNMCGNLYVDINGAKKPNKFGVDFFIFNLTKNGIVAPGFDGDKQDIFKKECNLTSGGGSGCTAWVLLNENMDYLRCNDLDWNTKTKCK